MKDNAMMMCDQCKYFSILIDMFTDILILKICVRQGDVTNALAGKICCGRSLPVIRCLIIRSWTCQRSSSCLYILNQRMRDWGCPGHHARLYVMYFFTITHHVTLRPSIECNGSGCVAHRENTRNMQQCPTRHREVELRPQGYFYF